MGEYVKLSHLLSKGIYMHGFGGRKFVAVTDILKMVTKDVAAIVYCKDCIHRGDYLSCPMADIEFTWNDDDGGDVILHDKTQDYGYCHVGEAYIGGI